MIFVRLPRLKAYHCWLSSGGGSLRVNISHPAAPAAPASAALVASIPVTLALAVPALVILVAAAIPRVIVDLVVSLEKASGYRLTNQSFDVSIFRCFDSHFLILRRR